MQIVDSLKERGDYYDQYPIEHTVSFILGCYRDLAHERGLATYDYDFPYEFVSYSLERMDTFVKGGSRKHQGRASDDPSIPDGNVAARELPAQCQKPNTMITDHRRCCAFPAHSMRVYAGSPITPGKDMAFP
jgi:hypothetical protein